MPTLRRFLAGSGAVGLALVAQQALNRELWWSAAALFCVAAAVWLWATLRPQPGESLLERPRAYVAARHLVWPRWNWLPRRLRFAPWLIGALCALAGVGLAVWNWRAGDVTRPGDEDWLRYGASVALFLVGALVLEPWRGAPLPRAQQTRSRLYVLLFLAAIVALAAAVRLINLDSMPFGTWYDEAANGLEALRVLREPAYRPFYTDGVNSTGHYLFLIVASFKLLGESTVAIRLISALMGIATVLAAYFFGRELHSPTLGLVLAFIAAVARWSITFSRLGMYNMATPLFELLVLAWLLRGLRRGSVLDFTLAGISLGVGLCFYAAFQLFLPVLAFCGLWVAWRERARWPRVWAGAGIMMAAALLVVAPVVQYALVKPESYFARVQKTSLFTGKEPSERLPALWANTRKHLLMFNVHGDPNGRHNLPGAPMLDWVSGGLLVLGLATCLARGRDPALALGPIWVVAGLMGGILSLDFEAPQSLRAIGAQPAVLLLAAWPLVELDRLWREGGGRYAPSVGVGLVAPALLLPMAVANLHTYFVRQAHDFSAWNVHSTAETYAARLLRAMEPGTDAYLISLFDGHPTIRFLAQGITYRRIETSAMLPIPREGTGDLLLILDVERRKLFEQAKRLYPNARFEEVRAPFGGPPTLLIAHIPAAEVRSIQGLAVTYWPLDAEQADVTTPGQAAPQVDAQAGTVDLQWPEDAPLPLPFEAEWVGVVAAGSYGRYQFFVEAPAAVELRIGEAVLLSGDAAAGLAAEVVLARGLHSIRLRAEGGAGRVRLAWQPPDGPPATIPAWALYREPVRSNGLLGRYYANGAWAGEPALEQIDPNLGMYFHVPILPRPYTVTWEGKLAIPRAGRYGFALRSIDESALSINGVAVAASPGDNVMDRGVLELEAGLHDIVVRFADRTNHTYINLYWLPPGSSGPESFQIIPADFLFPPQADYAAVDVTDLGRFMRPEPTAAGELVHELLDPAAVTVAVDGLAAPRGVAVMESVVYVAESGAGRVVAYDPRTATSRTVATGEQRLLEPFDLAAHPSGRLVILDPGAAMLLLLDPMSGDAAQIPLDPPYVERSRGVSVGPDGLIWIANTAGRRVVAVDLEGTVVRELTLPPSTDGSPSLQPVDVAPMTDNTVYVTDVGMHQLHRFSLAGYLLQGTSIPVANSLDGPHLAVVRPTADVDSGWQDSLLYMSQPETGRIVMYDAIGNPLAAWTVRTPATPRVKPVGLAVDDEGVIWVADSEEGRLLRLAP